MTRALAECRDYVIDAVFFLETVLLLGSDKAWVAGFKGGSGVDLCVAKKVLVAAQVEVKLMLLEDG